MPADFLHHVSLADWIGLAVFGVGWLGYGWYADRSVRGARGLRFATDVHRLQWAREMVRRENRMTDVALTGNLMQSVSFYASTTTYIIAGVIAVAGTLDRLTSLTAELPFAKVTARELTEFKVLLLAAIFIFAYFKFTWALRQFNFLSIMVGGAPAANAPEDVAEPYARRFALLSALAGDEFNRGVRAYYFGFAAMTWFISPQHFIAFTAIILAVLWRRDYRSHTLRVLQGGDASPP
ncbi:MAG: DUF599 domain-containing protein [Burkholderiales bacterium]